MNNPWDFFQVSDAFNLFEQMSYEVQLSAVQYVAGFLDDWKSHSSYRLAVHV